MPDAGFLSSSSIHSADSEESLALQAGTRFGCGPCSLMWDSILEMKLEIKFLKTIRYRIIVVENTSRAVMEYNLRGGVPERGWSTKLGVKYQVGVGVEYYCCGTSRVVMEYQGKGGVPG